MCEQHELLRGGLREVGVEAGDHAVDYKDEEGAEAVDLADISYAERGKEVDVLGRAAVPGVQEECGDRTKADSPH